MPFLAINGIELDVTANDLTETVREIGETTSAYDGTLRKSRQSSKRDLEGSCPVMLQTDAYAWEQLIRGMGETWSFEGAHPYGSKGTAPTNTTGSLAYSVGTVKFGSRSFQLSNTVGATYATTYPFTISCWHYYSAAWHHRFFSYNSAGVAVDSYLDGVSSAGVDGAESLGFFWEDQAIKLGADAGTVTVGTYYFDDLVILPFVAPTSWAASIYAAGAAFSDLPKLTVTGDAIAETTRSCMGEIDRSEFVKAVVSGSFRTTARKLVFRLSQV